MPANSLPCSDMIARMEDTPKTARRRARKMRTVSQMIAMNCKGQGHADRTRVAHCGAAICAACAELDAYAMLRTQRCRSMEENVTCEECGNRCYAHEQRELIRQAMRYAGPRMIFVHPLAAIRHIAFNE